MAESNDVLLAELKKQTDLLTSIKGWITFFGVLMIIGTLFSACNAIFS